MTTPPSSYVPDDNRITLSSLEFLRTPQGAALRSAVADLLATSPNPTVSEITKLRKLYPSDATHAALTLGQIQKKAHEKFPALPYVWATPEALEQSTDSAVAAHKASRFAAAGAQNIIDFCAGIGGDTLALAAFAPTTAVELSTRRAACLRFNLEDISALSTQHSPLHPVQILTQNLYPLLEDPTPLPPTAFIHIDPSRRAAGKRSAQYNDLIPPPETLEKLFHLFPNSALKLSSAADFESLPEGHLELISHHASVVQAILWKGQLATLFPPNTRTATIISATHAPFSFTARPSKTEGLQSLGPPHPPYLYELDGSLTRSNLAAPFAQSLQLTPLTLDAGYLTSDSLLQSPALTPFQLHTILPFSESRVTDALLQIPAPPGPVEVKSRGAPLGINTDHLQKIWSKSAHRKLTVLLFRHHDDTLAALATRL